MYFLHSQSDQLWDCRAKNCLCRSRVNRKLRESYQLLAYHKCVYFGNRGEFRWFKRNDSALGFVLSLSLSLWLLLSPSVGQDRPGSETAAQKSRQTKRVAATVNRFGFVVVETYVYITSAVRAEARAVLRGWWAENLLAQKPNALQFRVCCALVRMCPQPLTDLVRSRRVCARPGRWTFSKLYATANRCNAGHVKSRSLRQPSQANILAASCRMCLKWINECKPRITCDSYQIKEIQINIYIYGI